MQKIVVVKNEVRRDHAFTISGGLANGGDVARIGGAVVNRSGA